MQLFDKPGWMLQLKPSNGGPTNDDCTYQGIPWRLLPSASAQNTSIDQDSSSMWISERSGGPNACQLSAKALLLVSEATDAHTPTSC